MKNLKLTFKLFYRDKIILLALLCGVGFEIYSIWSTTASLFEPNETIQLFSVLQNVLRQSNNVFIFFAFLSYYFYIKPSIFHAKETIRSIQNAMHKNIANQSVVLLTVSLAMSLCFVLYGLIIYAISGVDSIEFVGHYIENIFLNFFLLSILAIAIGLLMSFFDNPLKAIAALAGIILLTSDFLVKMAFSFFDGKGINIYPLTEIFNLFPTNLSATPNTQWGFSVLPLRYERILFWGFLVLFVIFLALSYGKIRKVMYTGAATMAALSILCGALYINPHSDYIRGLGPTSTTLGFAHEYLAKGNVEEEKADFYITDYAIDLKIRDILTAQVTLTPNITDLKQYVFTLYSGYQVKEVTDQDGSALNYKQENDTLTIEGSQKLIAIKINYSGYSNRFYSNTQGSYLAGYFPYYPMPGKLALYNEKDQAIIPHELTHPANFSMKLDYGKTVYTNLKAVGENKFASTASSVTIASGFLKEVEVGGFTVVYPNIEYSKDLWFLEEGLKDFEKNVSSFEASGIIESGTMEKLRKNICFIPPNINQLGIERGVFLKDCNILSTSGFYDLAEGFYKQQLNTNPDRKELVEYLWQENTQKGNFKEQLEFAREFSGDAFSQEAEAMYQAAQRVGYEEMIHRASEFARDKDSQTKTLDFFNAMK